MGVLLFLLASCLTQRIYIAQNAQEKAVFLGISPGMYLFFAAATAALFLLYKVWNRLSERTLFLMGTALYLAAGIYLIANVEPVLRADAKSVFDAALQFNRGDTSALDLGNYMATHPHQLGLMSLQRLWLALARIDGTASSAALGTRLLFAANWCYVIAINFLMWRLSRMWFQRETTAKCTIVLSFLFLPQFFFILFAYGLLPGLVCLLLALFFLTRYLRGEEERRWRYFVLTAVAAAAAVVIRNNYMIGVLAMIAVVFLNLLAERRPRDLALLLCLALTLLVPAKIVQPYYQWVSGKEVGDGMPMSLYVAMAMQEGSRGNGWYNAYSIRTYEEAGYDSQAADDAARKDIALRWKEFKSDPSYAAEFYLKKVQSTWCEPTFQSIWSGPLPDRDQETYTPLLRNIYGGGSAYHAIAAFCQAVVIWVLAFSAAALAVLMRGRGERFEGESPGRESAFLKRRPETLFPVIFLMGGFLFHILWEAKSQYVYVYIFVLILLAAYGLDEVGKWLERHRLSQNL